MTIYPYLLMLPLLLGQLALRRRRAAIEGRPDGVALYRVLQSAIFVAAVGVLCWQIFSMGFQMGGDIARRDARNEAMAAAAA